MKKLQKYLSVLLLASTSLLTTTPSYALSLGDLLMGMVVPKIMGQSDEARVKTTETVLANVSNILDLYKLDNFRYPTTGQGLDALITPVADAKNFPEGGYLKGGYPKDGWQNELQYVSPGTEGRPYDLFSLGADGEQGGEGIDADIYAKL